jgi:hypothetical protein
MSIFSSKDYNSGDGMCTTIWGPPLWHVLHTISFNYPIKPSKDEMKYYYEFYNNLKNILPCRICRDNLVNNFKQLPLTFSVLASRDSLSRWVYNLHELINKMLGKTSYLSYDEVRDRYEHFRSRCLTNREQVAKNHETGCIEPLYGVKSKCILNIVPRSSNKNTFKIDPKCKLKRKKNSKK